MAQVGFPWINFLLSVKYVHFHNGIPPWTFSHSNEAAPQPIHLLHCHWLAYFDCTHQKDSSADSTISCWGLPSNCKTFPCGGQEQEQLVNTAPPQLPRLCLHKFSLLACGQQQSRDALWTSILWMLHDHPMNCLDQTGHGMMCHSGIYIKLSIFFAKFAWYADLFEDLMRSGRDWTTMLQSYLILLLKVLDSKASKSGSLPSIVRAVCWISNSLCQS